MPTDIQHFRRQNSYRAIVGGKGFIQLRHDPTDAGSALHQMDFDAHVSQIQCGLNASDTATDDENVFQIGTPFISNFGF
jgi:hypothetical protein